MRDTEAKRGWETSLGHTTVGDTHRVWRQFCVAPRPLLFPCSSVPLSRPSLPQGHLAVEGTSSGPAPVGQHSSLIPPPPNKATGNLFKLKWSRSLLSSSRSLLVKWGRQLGLLPGKKRPEVATQLLWGTEGGPGLHVSASLAVSWLNLQLCGFGVVSPPLSAMLFSKGFPVKVGRGCSTSSSRASFIPNFQRLATEVHQLLALGSWPVATALRASPSAQSARASLAHPVGLCSVCPC